MTAKQDSDKQQDTSLTSDSAMNYLIKAPGDQSFADFQKAQAAQGIQDPNAAQDAQTAQAAVTAQNVQVQQDPQAVSDAQAAQDSQTAQDATQPTTQVQDTGALDLDDADDAAMQQALLQSRQQAQMQGSDPTASSSAGPERTIEDEIQFELQMGRDFKREAEGLENKMSTRRLSVDEVQRMRKLSELMHINQQRADLCERQIQENQAQQAPDTSALLKSLRPLQPSRSKTPVVKTPPKGKATKAMPHHL